MMKKFKAFYNKECYDYNKGNVDPFEFHSTFYFFIKWFGLSNYDTPPKFLKFKQLFLIINTLIGLVITVLATYHAIDSKKLLDGTEAICYFIVLMYKLLMISCTLVNKKNYHNFLTCVKIDFQDICTKNEKYRKRYFTSQMVTFKICVLFAMIIWAIPICMVFFTLSLITSYLVFQEDKEETVRPLPFPIWIFDLDFNKSPYYELALFYTNYTILLYGLVYVLMSQNNVMWVRQITSKADLIKYRLQDLLEDIEPTSDPLLRKHYDDLIRLRMRDIIQEHHSMYRLLDDYAAVHKKLFMYEQKLCGPVLCLCAYGVSEKLSAGELQGILLLLWFASFLVILIPSYFCTFLGVKIRSVVDACWDIHFWKCGTPVIRPYIVLIIQRSMRPLPLQAAGFAETSLQTFSNVMTSAYSMFNMLRQADLNLA